MQDVVKTYPKGTIDLKWFLSTLTPDTARGVIVTRTALSDRKASFLSRNMFTIDTHTQTHTI